MNQYPAEQPFNKAKVIAAMNERFNNGVHIPKNLKRRQKDFDLMIAQQNFNRDSVTKPGSNKKH